MVYNSQKIVAITGATGLIGSALNLHLTKNGYLVKVLKRGFAHNEIDGCDIVINLAGSTINCRWTKSAKKQIRESRIETTRRVVNAINTSQSGKPTLFISASAIGIYPSSNGLDNRENISINENTSVDENSSFDENSPERGDNFLSQICTEWESEALKTNSHVRVIITRFGVALSPLGGALPKMSIPYKLGIAGTIGKGKQPFSWIALEDLVGAIEFLIEREDLSGVFNLTSPNPINNSQLTQTLALHYKCPIKVKIPSFVFEAVYGKAAILFTEGQKVIPKRLMDNGFKFNFTSIERCMQR